MIRRIPILLLGFAFLSSCVYPYTPDLESSEDKTLVVDGQIFLGGTSTIKLENLTHLSQTTTSSPTGKAWIEDDQGDRYTPISSAQSSSFQIPTETAPLGREYRAVIEVGGKTYVSDWVKPDPAPVITGIRFDADDTNVTAYVDLDTGSSRSGYLGFSYEETWQFHSDFMTNYTVIPGSWEVIITKEEYPNYWCYRTTESKQMVLLDYSAMEGGAVRNFALRSFKRTDSRNHSRYSLLVKAFALSRDAYDYNRRTQEMSEVGGDLFSPEPGMLKGNLRCESDPGQPVMGLVLAGAMTSQRAFLGNQYLIDRAPNEGVLTGVSKDQMPHYYYELDYRPVKEVTREGSTFVAWGPLRCIDCIAAGGTKEVPDFWK